MKKIVFTVLLFFWLYSTAFAFEANFAALCSRGTLQQVYEAIESGADAAAADMDGWTALMRAVKENPDPAVIRFLLNSGANVNARVSQITLTAQYGESALMMASISRTDPEVLRMLVLYGANVDAVNGNGETALIMAICYNPNAQIIQALIDCGANVDVKTAHGRTALMEAALRHKSTEIVRILIDAGARIDAATFELTEEFNPNKAILDTLRDGYRRQRSKKP
jgi:ankyrin repeat protein